MINKVKTVVYASILTFSIIAIASFASNMKKTFKDKTPTSEVLSMTTENGKLPGIVRLTTLNEGKFYCSGAVISDTEILTAAHCVFGLPLQMNIESITVNNEKVEVLGNAAAINIRADVAIIKGDFSKFSKLKYEPSPAADILVNNYHLAGCGFPYAGELVCYKLFEPVKMIDVIGVKGQLYAGMSGGPVVDLETGTIYAVNHAVAQEIVLIAPIINLKDGLQLILEPQ